MAATQAERSVTDLTPQQRESNKSTYANSVKIKVVQYVADRSVTKELMTDTNVTVLKISDRSAGVSGVAHRSVTVGGCSRQKWYRSGNYFWCEQKWNAADRTAMVRYENRCGKV